LVWRLGSLDYISDNAGCFTDRPFPKGGSILTFSAHCVYVATVAPPRYPRKVRNCTSPPRGTDAGRSTADPSFPQEVMVTGDDTATKNMCVCGPQLERNGNTGGGSGSAPPSPPPSKLEAARPKLRTPLAAGADQSTLEAELEAQRLLLLQQVDEIAAAKRQLEITTREYSTAHGFTLAGDGPSRVGAVRRRGGALGGELHRDRKSAPIGSMRKPV
jgi:hypothetical protein